MRKIYSANSPIIVGKNLAIQRHIPAIFKDDDLCVLKVEKGWGYELWLHNSPESFCAKILHMNSGGIMSMHLHLEKKELFRVLSGEFTLNYIDGKTGKLESVNVFAGHNIYLSNGVPHQLKCISEGDVIELSTLHKEEDSIRVSPGDSQKEIK